MATSFGNNCQLPLEELLTDLTAKYLFKIKEENRLTQSTIQKIAMCTADLFSVACRRLKRKVDQSLEDANIEDVLFEMCSPVTFVLTFNPCQLNLMMLVLFIL